MRSKVLQAMDIFADERHFRLRLFFEGLLIGALTGALIAVFRYLLEGSEDLRRLAYHWLRTAEPGWFLLYGAAFLLAAFLLAAIVRREPLSSGSGIPQIKGILLGKMHMHWASVLLYKFLGGVLAIGMGLSLGREGPSVQLGASIGPVLKAQSDMAAQQQEMQMRMQEMQASLQSDRERNQMEMQALREKTQAEVESILGDYLQLALSGQMSAEQALQQAQQRINRAVKKA